MWLVKRDCVFEQSVGKEDCLSDSFDVDWLEEVWYSWLSVAMQRLVTPVVIRSTLNRLRLRAEPDGGLQAGPKSGNGNSLARWEYFKSPDANSLMVCGEAASSVWQQQTTTPPLR